MSSEVKNAADAKQVKQAEENIEFKEDAQKRDLIDVLSTPQGRRVLWRVMEWSGCEGTPHRQTNELTYMAIGSGDVGRWLKAEILNAGETFLFNMMKENAEKKGETNGRREKGRNASNGNAESGNAKGGDSDDGNA